MEMQSPAEIDAEFLDWLVQSAGLRFETMLRPGSLQTHLEAVESGSTSTRSPPTTIKRAISALEKILRPARDAELRGALVSLERATARSRGEGEDDLLERYLAKLRQYPADIALHVCATWDDRPGDEGTYFPKPAQLKQACEELFAARRRWLPALQRFERGEVHRTCTEDEKSDADIAAVRAIRDRVSRQLNATARETVNGYVESAARRASINVDAARREAEVKSSARHG